MKISLVMATVGRASEVERFFKSLKEQSSRDMELIVVDQNEDDSLVRPVAILRDAGVEVVHLKCGERNLSKARNYGIARARNELVGFPDDDCWYEKNLIETILANFSSSADLDGLVGRWHEQDPVGGEPKRLTWDRMREFREASASSITLFFRKQVVEQIGGFDENLGISRWFGAGEETDLVMRCLRRGANVRYIPNAVVHHAWAEVSAGGTTSDTFARIRARSRGTGALYAKHRLPFYVILRGILAPLLRLVVPPYGRTRAVMNAARAIGRFEGYFSWLWNQRLEKERK